MAKAALSAVRDEAYATPLDMSLGQRFADDTIWPYFDRLRKEAPVNYCPNSHFSPYWSITPYNDIVAVDTNHKVFSSVGGITLLEPRSEELRAPNFISMDPPKRDEQHKAVSPIVAPANLFNFEPLIRQRTITVLESLPVNETFNWVDRVSIELTTQMLATLFDFLFEDRRLLTHWSDVVTTIPVTPADRDYREGELQKCLAYFVRIWNERVNAPPRPDLISMLAHNPATNKMPPREYLGNLALLIVGGNDATRNSMTGGLYHLSQNPAEYDKLRANPELIPNMISEIIRYQTPLAYMRRRPRTTKPEPGHKIYPYLLRGMEIARANQVWATDITYILMARGFVYLMVVLDWFSRRVLSWRVSVSMDASFCIEALEEALAKHGKPEIFKTDQGSQFTGAAFTGVLIANDIKISMDGKGAWRDNVFVERLCRSVKYEEVYLHAYASVSDARTSIGRYLDLYNRRRPYSSLDDRTPDQAYFNQQPIRLAA